MIEVGMISSGMAGDTYRWADGAESVGVLFRYLPEERLTEFGDRLSVLITTGKVYDSRPHIFWLDDYCNFIPGPNERIYATPRASVKLRSSRGNINVIGPIIGPKPGSGNNVGICGNCPEVNFPTISVNDPSSLATCGVVLVTEKNCWTEGFEAACKAWGTVVVTGQGWTKPNNNWIMVDPKWGWEKSLREGMKRVNNRVYSEALKRAGMMPTGAESLAGNVRRVLPNQNNPITRISTGPKAVRITTPSKPQPRKSSPIPTQPYYDLKQQESIQVSRASTNINKAEYTPPNVSEISTPPWFANNDEVEVSVIIPMWRSAEVITQLIQSWDFSNPRHEIIFVSDACPHNSHQAVITALAARQPTPSIGKLLALSQQSGFSTACNVGALHSRGKYLVFLNADTTVTQGWLDPLIEPLRQDPNIGIVGNLQVKNDDSIDSAGSQWMWQTRSFEHIGRNVWQGGRLSKRMKISQAPPSMLADGKRQMVTGCCVAIENEFFKAIGGFDIKYRIGYWEDADLCMKVWDAGKTVHFTSKSKIYHKGGHSGGSGHPFMKDNAKLFYSKWVDNGKFNEWIKT